MHKAAARAAWNLTVAALAVAGAAVLAQQPAPQAPPAGGRQGGAPAARQGGPGPGVPRVPSLPFPDAPQELDTLGPKIRVVPMAKGLVNAWGIAFLPNGDVLVTEKPGRLRIIRKGTLDPQPIAGVPEVYAVGQGGLLEVLPHPRFAENQLLYLTYSKSRERTSAPPAAAPAPPPGQAPPREGTTVLARGRFDGKALTDVRELFVADNWNTGNPHYGGKLAFGRDGMLYMTIGERGDRNRAQNTALHGGRSCGSRRTAPRRRTIRLPDATGSSRRSTRTATATRRGSPSIRRPGRSGKRSTDRREATSSTRLSREGITAGRLRRSAVSTPASTSPRRRARVSSRR